MRLWLNPVTIVLLLLMMGIVDFGWMVFNYSQLFNGLREGTRYGSVAGFGTTPQFEDCQGIRDRVVAMAGFAHLSAASAVDITIWYDDGRDIDDSSENPVAYNVSPRPNEEVGWCDGSYVYDATTPSNDQGVNTNYKCQPDPNVSGSCSTAGARPIENGDRINIRIQKNIQFLTPFLRSGWPSGLPMDVQSARSIFPSGLSS